MFKQWCQENRLNNASNLSHVLMNGGKLSIPEDRLKEFYKVYCDAVKSGEKLYVVEQNPSCTIFSSISITRVRNPWIFQKWSPS